MDKTEKKTENLDCYISGNIEQSQSCNVDVKQPNNNIVASRNISSKQNKEVINENLTEEESNISDFDQQGQVLQQANSKQNTEQPESNACEVDGATINQNNHLNKSE
jgi:hypothetical protein